MREPKQKKYDIDIYEGYDTNMKRSKIRTIEQVTIKNETGENRKTEQKKKEEKGKKKHRKRNNLYK